MIIEIDLWADYGHFSHPATIYSSLTYPIPPKTAIMGFLGAVGGFSDSSEYQFLNAIQYAVKINSIKGKANYSFNGVKDALPSIKHHTQMIKQRKQFYRELLIQPNYKLFLDFSACEEESRHIIDNLKAHRSLYQPYMGINLCLANFEFISEHQSQPIINNAFISIDSFVPLETSFEIEPNKNYSDIRIACQIEAERTFGNFTDLLVELNGNTILAQPNHYTQVKNYKLILI
ncbi:MAG: CRISPR-associated protein Cas5 [Campylobacterota bacterium]|nr:CRISPR-associated protein Cas5 [Campylobacterota bacterium]